MQIGPYDIEDILGEGGMGVVYRARSRVTGEAAAVKTVRLPRPATLASIRREIYRLLRLRHPGVVRVFEHGIHDGVPWYAMELLTGSTWGQRFSSSSNQTLSTAKADSLTRDGWGRGDVPPDEIVGEPIKVEEIPALCRVTRRLCEALSYIHGEGVVHRDLKPANVFVRDDGQPILFDFGLVVEHSGSAGREVLDVEAIHAGTVAYMAPEQLNGALVDARADVFALGCMLYESLTGRVPFSQSLDGRRYGPPETPRPPSRLTPWVPEALDELVLGMLEHDPRDRIGHASDIAAALDRHLGATEETTAGEPRAYVYRSRFAGRSEAMETLTARVAALSEGRGGRVLVEGESGSGKTRLVMEVVRSGPIASHTMIACECAPLDASTAGERLHHLAPLSPLRPLLGAVADRCRAGAEVTERLLGARLGLLSPIEPSLAQLPGADRWPDPPPLPPEAAKHRLLSAMTETLLALAKEAPVLLLIDDLHWADELTLELVGYLDPERLAGAAVLIICTCRSEDPVPELEALRSAPDLTRLTLARLDENTVSVLVGDILAVKRAPAELVRFIADRAEGNPFFVNEYLRTAVTEGVLRRTAHAEWQLAGGPATESGGWTARLEALSLPRTLREIVARRLASLDDDLLELVTTAAVLGREFDGELLQALCPRDEGKLADAMNDLLRRNVFVPSTGGRYRFAHDKLREGAADSIPPERLRGMHRAVAQAYEARGVASDELTTLAHHWGQAEEADQARKYLTLAGEQALKAGAHQEAAPLFERALTLADPHAAPLSPEGAAHLRQRHADALWGLGDTHRGAVEAEAALALMGVKVPASPAAVAWALTVQLVEQLGRVWFRGGKAAPPKDEPLAVARAEAALRLSQCYFASQRSQAQTMYATLLAANRADRAGVRGPKAVPYATLGAAAGMVRMERLAQHYFQAARDDANQRADPASLAAAGIMEASHFYVGARWSEFDARIEEDLAIAARVGDRPAWEGLSLVAGGAALLRGRLADGATRLESVRGSAGARAGHYMNAWATGLLALHALWDGRTDTALELGQSAQRDFRDDGGVAVANPIAVQVAALAMRGQRDEALAKADEALALLRKGPILYFMWPACDALTTGLCMLWQNDAGAEVRKRALAAVRLARTLGTRGAIGRPIALRAEAAAARLDGRTRRALSLLDAAESEARALGMPMVEAQVLRERERLQPPAGELENPRANP